MSIAEPSRDRVHVRLLGDLVILRGEQPLRLPLSRKTRALFVYLLRNSRPVRRERLCELFFAGADDPRAALRWSLSKIRAMLGETAGALITERQRVGLRHEAFDVDVDSLHVHPLRVDIEALLDDPLAGLEAPHLDEWNAWLAAERAEIDRRRAEALVRAAGQTGLTAERRALLRLRSQHLDAGVAPPPEDVHPLPLEQIIRYCRAADGVAIAYTTTGQGPALVKAANWLNHLELDWSGPIWSGLFQGLSEKNTLVRYDERGNGLSDREVEDLTFDAFVRDLETTVDALGLEQFPLLGISQGCAVSIAYAVSHPERVSKLILLGGYAAGWRHVAPPEEAERRQAVMTLVRTGWGQENPAYRQIFSQTFMPSATHEELAWFNEFQRQTTSPHNAVRFLEAFADIDVRDQLAQVRAPTLVLHARGDQRVAFQSGVELAAAIPNARLVALDTDNHIPLSREPANDRIVAAIQSFLDETPE